MRALKSSSPAESELPFKDSKDYVYYGFDKPVGLEGVDFDQPIEDFMRNLFLQDTPPEQLKELMTQYYQHHDQMEHEV